MSMNDWRFFNIYFFFFNDTATTEIYTLSLHDALPISAFSLGPRSVSIPRTVRGRGLGPPGLEMAIGDEGSRGGCPASPYASESRSAPTATGPMRRRGSRKPGVFSIDSRSRGIARSERI